MDAASCGAQVHHHHHDLLLLLLLLLLHHLLLLILILLLYSLISRSRPRLILTLFHHCSFASYSWMVVQTPTYARWPRLHSCCPKATARLSQTLSMSRPQIFALFFQRCLRRRLRRTSMLFARCCPAAFCDSRTLIIDGLRDPSNAAVVLRRCLQLHSFFPSHSPHSFP